MFQSLRHGITRLHRFDGRDTPRLFWPYAGMVLGLVMALSMIGVMAIMAQIMPRIIAFANAHPGQSHVESGPTEINVTIDGPFDPQMFPPAEFAHVINAILGANAAIVAIVVVLLGAAITRRLHDSGVSGAVALVPLAITIAGLVQMRALFASTLVTPPDPMVFAGAFATNLAYLVSMAGLVYLLVRRGAPVANRYGEAH
jgi:uncharacterized membrane protein YhaH (DUF805 family)